MKRIILDTNIIYYLVDISPNEYFHKEKLQKDLSLKVFDVGITYFTMLEIMQKYKNNRNILNKILRFLKANNVGIIYDLDSKFSINKIYDKCLNSKNKVSYYKHKFLDISTPYFVNFIDEILMLLGGLYLRLLCNEDVEESKLAYKKSLYYFHTNHIKIIELIKKDVDELYENYYKVDFNLNYRKKLRDEKFKEIIVEVCKLFLLVYQTYLSYPRHEDIIKNFEDLRASISNTTIQANIIEKLFKKKKGHGNFNVVFKQYYDELYPERENDTRSQIIKYIIKRILVGKKFDFNDVIDGYNLMAAMEFIKDFEVLYLTTDTAWIDFLKENKYNNFYNSCLDLIKNYYENI